MIPLLQRNLSGNEVNGMEMQNVWRHLVTITEHKCLVMLNCFNVGLYRQGL